MPQLSLTEVSKRFNVNRTTIYRAVSNGKLSRLNNGLFDLAEVIRVFGEPPATAEAAPVPDKGSKLVEVLERELLFLKKQLEQKDNQIDHLQRLLVAPETSAQRPEATTCNDTETPIDQAMQHDETPYEANSSVTKQHDATAQNETVKRGLFDRIDRGLKAFLK